MSLACQLQLKCMASIARRARTQWSRCEQIACRSLVRSLPLLLSNSYHTPWSGRSTAFYSTTRRTRFPRDYSGKRPDPRNYPGFRNETRQHKLVRTHNLFDPSMLERDRDGVLQLASPNLEGKLITTRARSQTTSAELERELLYLSTHSPHGRSALKLLSYLVYDRRARPNAIHYEALILANVSPEDGSADNLRQLLQEMEEHKIPMNVNIYTALLRALVVHPSVELLTHVVESCETMWIPLDREMLHYVSAIYLRAGMPDMAMLYLQQIEALAADSYSPGSETSNEAPGAVALWLYVLFIRHLVFNNDWEGVMRMCYRLNDDTSLGIPLAARQVDVPFAFWEWLLYQAADAHERWVSFWIWDTWVLRMWIRPTPALCMKMLQLSAAHGLVREMESVVTVLDILISEHHLQKTDETAYSADAKEEITRLVNMAHENAGVDAPQPSSGKRNNQNCLSAANWWMFEDKMGIKTELGIGLKIDPWTVISKQADAGRAWPRLLRERELEEKRRHDQNNLRIVANDKNKTRRALHAVQTLPEELLRDIDAIAIAASMMEDNPCHDHDTHDWGSKEQQCLSMQSEFFSLATPDDSQAEVVSEPPRAAIQQRKYTQEIPDAAKAVSQTKSNHAMCSIQARTSQSVSGEREATTASLPVYADMRQRSAARRQHLRRTLQVSDLR